MSLMWCRKREGKDRGDVWAIALLDGDHAIVLTGDPDQPLSVCHHGRRKKNVRAYLRRSTEPGNGEKWVLFVAAGDRVHVNGTLLAVGMRVLKDRDEIGVGNGDSVFFSTERLARVQPFPGIGREAKCPRCWDPIQVGSPAVQCPRCGVWHHQDTENNRPCWTYTEKCAASCDQSTDLQAGYQWTPEES
jgi:hypothetical protein